MENVYLIGARTSAFVLLVQSGMLWLQAGALRRHGHRSFLLLAIGSVLGILYCLTSFPLYLMHLGEDAFWALTRSEEHTSELQSLMRISYAVFCLKKKK